MTWNTTEQVEFANITATTAAFSLKGGQYAVTAHGTWGGGSLTLQRLAADGSTFVNCLSAFTADGYATVNLPNGTYKFAVVTATGIYVDITSIVVA